jgi:hypothetical protein
MTTTTSGILSRPRFGTQRSPERATLGPAVGEVARMLGKPFMPWQQHVADVVLEIDPETGRLAYSEFGLTVPRQSGKSTFVLAKAIHRGSATGFFGRRQGLVYTAQTRKDARKKWEEDFIPDVEASRVFCRRVAVHKGNGNEHFRFTNGSRFGIESATEKAGHGPTLDEAYIDEAFAQVDNRLEQAFSPAMITRPNKQLGWISTAGWLGGSPYLEDKARLGRLAVANGWRSGLAYFEWSAPEDADPGDEAVWWECMPALGHTITIEAMRDVYRKAVESGKINDFKRPYLNIWVPKPVAAVPSVVPVERWDACLDPGSSVAVGERFALDVSPDQSRSAIAVAGARADGLAHVELTSNGGVVDDRDGTDWVQPRLVDMKTRWPDLRVAVAAGSAAESLKPDLEAADIPVDVIPAREVAAACGAFYLKILAAEVRQIGQTELTTALEGARKRQEDGETGWVWGRRKSTVPIPAVYAATLAHWVHISNPLVVPSIHFL